MAYRGPTVTLLRLGKEGLLIVAIDVEWRLIQIMFCLIEIQMSVLQIYFWLFCLFPSSVKFKDFFNSFL